MADIIEQLADLLQSMRFEQKCDDYAESWAPVDDEIRHICEQRCQGHASLAITYPKVVVVDGAYRAGLSRCLQSRTIANFSAQAAVASWMASPAGQPVMKEAIESVCLASSADTSSFLVDCLTGHGRVVSQLSRLGDSGKWPTSFVSKYLHFHNSDYVIYDGVADYRLTRLMAKVGGLRFEDRVIPTPTESSYASAYYDYLCRFYYLFEAGRGLRDGVTVKELDHFLWNAWRD